MVILSLHIFSLVLLLDLHPVSLFPGFGRDQREFVVEELLVRVGDLHQIFDLYLLGDGFVDYFLAEFADHLDNVAEVLES